MLDRVHGNTTDSGPILPLRLSLVVGRLALRRGLSHLAPPAITPIMALQRPRIVFLTPDGSLTRDFFPSSECPMTIPEVPEARAMVPLSPSLASMEEIMVPSGIWLTGMMLPTWRLAFKPA